MANEVITIGERTIVPLIFNDAALGRPFIQGEDEQGTYFAAKLGDGRLSTLSGWYVLVSPEDQDLMQNYSWSGRLNNRNGTIEVRRREVICKKAYSIQLNQEIWKRINPSWSQRALVYRLGHTLDFRRKNLSLSRLRPGVFHGVVEHKGGFQVQISHNGKTIYIGRSYNADEAYRMFNRYLRDLKSAEPNDKVLQEAPYNEVIPKF